VGGARTVLYNWLHARQHGGTFVLRIEDTDAERNKPEWTEGILSALQWIGVDWDEGPFFQSQRAGEHRAAAERLFESGRAYYCDMTPEQVQERAGQGRQGYGGWSRDLGLEPAPGRVLRFRTPDEGTTVVHDVIRGDVHLRERAAGGLRGPAGQRQPDVPPRERGGRHRHAHHARGAWRGAPAEHAQGDPPVAFPHGPASRCGHTCRSS
jgi:glutamyl/glutaminyl-tRNA synthetase